MQRRLIQSKADSKIFYSIWGEKSQKTFKVTAAKTSFPSVDIQIILAQIASMNVLILLDNWKALIFVQI